MPYKRIYGVDEPTRLPPLANDGKLSHAPAGRDAVRPGRHVEPVQARELPERRRAARGASPPTWRRGHGIRRYRDWAGRSTGTTRAPTPACTPTSDIHAIRILAMEPTTDRNGGQGAAGCSTTTPASGCASSARFPVRKFDKDGKQPLDPDGNPDTSFLAKIPADMAFTFQTLDKDGMVLNMAQTWHQLRPGEIRNDCGGCHAHSQKPTALRGHRRRQARLHGLRPDAADAAVDRPSRTTSPARSGTSRTRPACASRRASRTSSTTATSSRSSSAAASPATRSKADKPAGNLVLDDDEPMQRRQHFGHDAGHLLPAGASTTPAKFGHKPVMRNGQLAAARTPRATSASSSRGAAC